MSGLRQTTAMVQGQSLVMTPQLSQSIKLLAMTNAQLDAYLAAEVERNPMLRRLAPPSPRRSGEAWREEIGERTAAHRTLADHLHEQIAMRPSDPLVARIAKAIASDLDESGRLPDPADFRRTLAAPERTFALALALVRGLEPAGVGASDLADCLALQLRRRDRYDPAMVSIVGRLDLVARGDRAGLREASGLDDADLDDALRELRALDPAPGRRFLADGLRPAPPDILLTRDRRGAWRVDLNEQTLPRIVCDRDYHAEIGARVRRPAERTYVAQAWQDANWLVRAVDQRARTVMLVAQAVVAAQDEFFERGATSMRPLTMRTIAERIGMHESTVSRVARGKTIEGPRGLVPLRNLFTTALPTSSGTTHAASAVRERIRVLVAQEGPHPLSDDAIVTRLEADGVEIARRTVAKYREALRIPSSTQRRRMRAVGHVAAGPTM